MKNFLRKVLLDWLEALPSSVEIFTEAAVNYKLKNLLTQNRHQVVIGYSKFFKGEISLKTLYLLCLKNNLKVFLTTLKGDSLIEVLEDASQNSKTLIPLDHFSCLNEKVLILAPCLAVDLCGIRLGRGKGFYDRFFRSYPQATKVVVCHDFQIFKKLPKDSWDLPADLILSGSKFISDLR